MKFIAIEIDYAINGITISTNSWTEIDISTLSKEDAKLLAKLLSTNKIAVACSHGSPCKDTAAKIIMKLMLK